MKRIAEKVALTALICITFVFVLLTILYSTGAIPQKENVDNTVAVVLLSVLAVAYIGLAVYLLIATFSEIFNVKRIVLFYDANSTTRANYKVINNIIKGCAKEFPQLKIKRTVFRVDEKLGLAATITLESMIAEDIAIYIPQLKALLTESFRDALGLTFNSFNFDVVKLSQKFTPTDTQLETTKQNAEEEDSDEDYGDSETVNVEDLTDDRDYETKQDDIAAGEEKHPADIW